MASTLFIITEEQHPFVLLPPPPGYIKSIT